MTTGRINQVTIPSQTVALNARPSGPIACSHHSASNSRQPSAVFVTKTHNCFPHPSRLLVRGTPDYDAGNSHPYPPDSQPSVRIFQSSRTEITHLREDYLEPIGMRRALNNQTQAEPQPAISIRYGHRQAYPQQSPADSSTKMSTPLDTGAIGHIARRVLTPNLSGPTIPSQYTHRLRHLPALRAAVDVFRQQVINDNSEQAEPAP